MTRDFWKLVHVYYFCRALLRGPRYFAGYILRREVRQAAYRATRNW